MAKDDFGTAFRDTYSHMAFVERVGDAGFSRTIPAQNGMPERRLVQRLLQVTSEPRLYSAQEIRILGRLGQQLEAAYHHENWDRPPPPTPKPLKPPRPIPQSRLKPGLLAIIDDETPVLRAARSAPPLPVPAPVPVLLSEAEKRCVFRWEDIVYIGRETHNKWLIRRGKQAETVRSLGEAVTLLYRDPLLKTGDWACTSTLEPKLVRATKTDDKTPKCWLEGTNGSHLIAELKLAAETRDELELFISLYQRARK